VRRLLLTRLKVAGMKGEKVVAFGMTSVTFLG